MRRIRSIQTAFKEKQAYDLERLADIIAWMDQGLATLRSLFGRMDKQNKKLREKFPQFLVQLNALNPDFKIAAARQHAAFVKYIHVLKLLRWSGDHLHGG